MGNEHKRLKRRRNRLFKAHPFCYWCNIKLIRPEDCKKPRKRDPDNMATIDHLRDKFDPLRQVNEGVPRTVLSCKKCNQDRSAKREALLSKEELWERSGRRSLSEKGR